MADVEKNVLIAHSAEKMYELVTKVEDYPNFLPWCGGVKVYEQTEEMQDAKIKIRFAGMEQFFRTRNTLVRPSNIDMNFVGGPFKSFYGSWQFNPLREDACKIVFNLHYEFDSFIIEKIIGPAFSVIANTFVDSFVKQADKVYGT